MTITISPETQELLERRLKIGDFKSTDELLHAALAALDSVQESGLDEETLKAIESSEEDIAAGRLHDWKDIREQVRARLSGR